MNFVLLLAVNIEKHEQEKDEKDPPNETLETNNKEVLVMDNFKNII